MKKGFTLLELMMVIAIIGIMSGVLLVSLSSLKARTSLKTAQSEVASAIKLAQNYALQGKIPPTIPGTIVCGYGFRFSDSNTYQIFYNVLEDAPPFADCEEQNSDTNSGYRRYNVAFSNDIPGEEKDLPSGVALSSSNAEIFFTIPHANVYANDGSSFNGDTWTFNASGNTKTITINERGLINEN